MRTKRIRSGPYRSSRDGSRLNADAGLQRLRRPLCRAAAAMSDQSSASMSVVSPKRLASSSGSACAVIAVRMPSGQMHELDAASLALD